MANEVAHAQRIVIEFPAHLDADERRKLMSDYLKPLGVIQLKGMLLKKKGYPDANYDGSDDALALADKLEIKYETI